MAFNEMLLKRLAPSGFTEGIESRETLRIIGGLQYPQIRKRRNTAGEELVQCQDRFRSCWVAFFEIRDQS